MDFRKFLGVFEGILGDFKNVLKGFLVFLVFSVDVWGILMVNAKVMGTEWPVREVEVGSRGGFERWVREVGSRGGFERWVREVGLRGGFERWVREVGLRGGFERWV